MSRVVAFVLALVLSATVAAEQVVITNGEWPPFLSKNYKEYGVVSHIVKDAFASQGVDVKYEFYPWARAYKLVEVAKADASVIWTRNEERDQQVLFSDPVVDLKDVFFFRKPEVASWNAVADFKGRKIGTSKGYYYGDEFAAAQKANVINVSEAKDDVINFKKLIAGRIDVFPITLDVGMATLNDNFSQDEIDSLGYDPKAVRQVSYHLIFNKTPKAQELMLKFNAGLKNLKDTGVYRKILARLKSW